MTKDGVTFSKYTKPDLEINKLKNQNTYKFYPHSDVSEVIKISRAGFELVDAVLQQVNSFSATLWKVLLSPSYIAEKK